MNYNCPHCGRPPTDLNIIKHQNIKTIPCDNLNCPIKTYTAKQTYKGRKQ